MCQCKLRHLETDVAYNDLNSFGLESRLSLDKHDTQRLERIADIDPHERIGGSQVV